MNNKEKYSEDASVDYAAAIKYLIEKSNRRAWLITFISLGIALLSVGAVFGLTPFKTVVPYIVRVNDVTGVVDIISTLDTKTVSTVEAVDKYFAGLYVTTREGYYFNTLSKDYILTQLLSSKRISEEYRLIYDGDHSRDKKLKNTTEVQINILSIVLGESAGTKMATIRYDEVTKVLSSKTTSAQTKVVTLSYEYDAGLKSPENERILNPLNFKVLTYRTDYEVKK